MSKQEKLKGFNSPKNYDKEIKDFATKFRLVKAMNEDHMSELRFMLKQFSKMVERTTKSIFDNDYKKLWEGEVISRTHYEKRTDELLKQFKEVQEEKHHLEVERDSFRYVLKLIMKTYENKGQLLDFDIDIVRKAISNQ